MTLFFTADTHFGHQSIIEYAKRPFRDLQDMEDQLVTRWNSVVGPKDEVHHLGDFSFGKRPDVERVLARLNGVKHLTPGNHDGNQVTTAGGWASVAGGDPAGRLVRALPGEHRVVCTHYQLTVWRSSHHGALHLYGHSHGSLAGDTQCCDVGVDCWNFRPVRIEQIQDRLATSPARVHPDYHQPRRETP